MSVCIWGAGSIGAYIGGLLIESGVKTLLVGREYLKTEIEAHGLTCTDLDDRTTVLKSEQVNFVSTVADLSEYKYILVSVKSADTDHVSKQLSKTLLHKDVVVISLQNGVRNADVLRSHLPDIKVLGGMVGFGVKWNDGAKFHRGTTNPIVIEKDAKNNSEEAIVKMLLSAGIPVEITTEMQAILYSKLLINLNNCVCALANQPLHIEFASAEYRQVLAGAISEGVAVCRTKGIPLTRIGRLYPPMMQYALLLPNFIYLRISRGMVAFKGVVYSSMWEDLHRKKPTEIDYLNGEVIRLGKELGVPTPVNEALLSLIKRHESDKSIPSYSGPELVRLTSAPSGAVGKILFALGSVSFAALGFAMYRGIQQSN